ncbi:cell wall-binding repeat-containing protein [Salinibacterium sp. NK8237]|uniref:cell wall-binding repeat-containing protein n=1 Tax=Salinibacterium sp. NK8237 TaxID=2792038 RepID=UPI0018CD0AB9|nr:cell wall-binding repeat-containing protein [Salinibacterium sp. NK8237]MBH0131374.1 cell wall-binding repeat-containing protein [Salinibacterium sp. NK8237]
MKFQSAAPSVSRLSGSDRYETAVAISQQFDPGVSVLYIANGAGYADALSAAPAAAVQGGPLLLTAANELPKVVVAEIKRLNPSKIVVAGGSSVVSGSVLSALKKLAPSVKRLGGSDRYETSRLIIDYAFDSAPTAYLATGRNFPDALSASAAAGSIGAPVILVDGNKSSIDKSTSALIKSLGVTQTNIAGGTGVVSSGIESALKKTTTVKRLSGSNRYATSAAINKYAFSSSSEAYFTVGTGFADALAGAALAGRNGSPLYVVERTCVSSAVKNDITALGLSQHVLLGGSAVLTSGVGKLTVCGSSTPKPTATTSNPGDTKNCSDFATYAQARTWYLKYYPQYGDVARLDYDNDGRPCETLPGGPSS